MNEASESTPLPTDRPTPAWPRVGAALLVGAAAGAAWFAIQTRSPSPPPAEAAAVAPEPAPSASAPRGDIAALLQVEEAAEPMAPEVAEGQALVCGQAVERDALAEERVTRTMHDAAASTALRAFAQSRLADDEHARAVGLALRAHAEPAAAGALTTELATLATRSTDARVLALARSQCQALAAQGPAPAHCALLGARRWVALEPDNAFAWLALAAEEPGSVDEGLYQAARATRYDDHGSDARRFVERVDPKGGLASLALVHSLMTLPPVRSIDDRRVLLAQCAADRVRADANRQQLCTQLADNLHARARGVAGVASASALAQTIGHAQAQARLRETRVLNAALRSAATDAAALERVAMECSLGLPRDLLARSAREGERAAVHAWIEASGVSDEQWLARAIESDDTTIKVAAGPAPDPVSAAVEDASAPR